MNDTVIRKCCIILTACAVIYSGLFLFNVVREFTSPFQASQAFMKAEKQSEHDRVVTLTSAFPGTGIKADMTFDEAVDKLTAVMARLKEAQNPAKQKP